MAAEPYVQILVRISPETHEELKACAQDEDRTMSATIRVALREHFDRHNEPDYPRSIPIGQLPSRPDPGIVDAPFTRMEPRLKSTKKGTP